MPDYVILAVMALVVIYWLLSVFTAIRRRRKQTQNDNRRKEELNKFFKLDIIDPTESKGALKTVEVVVTLPKGEECDIEATDDLYEKSNSRYSSFVPSFKSAGEQKIIEDGATVIKVSQKFEVKSATRTKISVKVGDWCTTLAEKTAFIPPQ
ncbi:MAG: hypothetical protein WC788_02220 [Candidatus Paceibacterota bacterium]|jgi:preprotein translocase subunit YajC